MRGGGSAATCVAGDEVDAGDAVSPVDVDDAVDAVDEVDVEAKGETVIEREVASVGMGAGTAKEDDTRTDESEGGDDASNIEPGGEREISERLSIAGKEVKTQNGQLISVSFADGMRSSLLSSPQSSHLV